MPRYQATEGANTVTTYRDRHLAGHHDAAKQEAKAEAKDAKEANDKKTASTKAATTK